MATDFSSLDKLIEFGLGLGIATQMMNTMNTVIARTAYPGVSINPGVVGSTSCSSSCGNPEQEKSQYYIVDKDKVAGPLNECDLSKLAEKEILTENTFCWYPGMTGWNLACNIPEINKIILLYKKHKS